MAKKAAKKVAKKTLETPAAFGYRMPAEWETQDAIWIAWPYYPDTWAEYLPDTERPMPSGCKQCTMGKRCTS